MQNHNSITQKPRISNRSNADQDRDVYGRFISSKDKHSYQAHHNNSESKLNLNESYNGGSTYGEH